VASLRCGLHPLRPLWVVLEERVADTIRLHTRPAAASTRKPAYITTLPPDSSPQAKDVLQSPWNFEPSSYGGDTLSSELRMSHRGVSVRLAALVAGSDPRRRLRTAAQRRRTERGSYNPSTSTAPAPAVSSRAPALQPQALPIRTPIICGPRHHQGVTNVSECDESFLYLLAVRGLSVNRPLHESRAVSRRPSASFEAQP
jgi:hypothetical protein